MNQTNPYPEPITYPNFAQYIAGNINATGLPQGSKIKAGDNGYNPSSAIAQTQTGTQTGGVAASTGALLGASTASASANTAAASKGSQHSAAATVTAEKSALLVVASIAAAVGFSAFAMLV